MPKPPLWVLVPMLVLTVPQSAGASVLTLDGETMLTVIIGGLDPVVLPMNVPFQPIDVSSAGGSFVLPENLFSGRMVLPTALFTGIPLVDGLTATISNHSLFLQQGAPGGGHPSGVVRSGGNLGGPGPLGGNVFVNVLALFNLAVPLSVVGQTGASTAVVAGEVSVTVQGTGWTDGFVRVTGITLVTTGGGTFSRTYYSGRDFRTPDHAGTLTLVSPFKVVTRGINAGNFPGSARLQLQFSAPEPGEALLIIVAITSSVLLALRRRRDLGSKLGEGRHSPQRLLSEGRDADPSSTSAPPGV